MKSTCEICGKQSTEDYMSNSLCREHMENMSDSRVQKDLKVKKGMVITIEARQLTVTGLVLSAEYNGDYGWYIELRDEYGEYKYYKQIYDGGKITSINA